MQHSLDTSFENTKEAIEFAIELLEEVLTISNQTLSKSYVEMYSLKYYLPYCLEKTSKKNVYMLANSFNKPLGYFETKWVDYNKFPNMHIHLNKEELKSVIKQSTNNILWYFPHEELNPISDAYEYLTILKRLLNILKSKK